MKKFLILFSILAFASGMLTAKNASFNGTEYNISVSYNESAAPGDVFFVTMRFDFQKSRKKAPSVNAVARLISGKKSIEKSIFYALNSKKKSSSVTDFLTGIPLSTWAEYGDYEISINYTVDGETEKTFSIPARILAKDFPKETIPLTESLTNIRTDTSPEKIQQSKKLNDLLAIIDPAGVYTLSKFIKPVASTRRTSHFGERRIFTYPSGKESTSMHAGIDFGVPVGTTVSACADGKIVMAENRITTGWSVIIEHLPGLYSIYYHMSSLNVKEGQLVKQGDQIGLSGATGFATGPHLHWEIRLDSVCVNPDFFTVDYITPLTE